MSTSTLSPTAPLNSLMPFLPGLDDEEGKSCEKIIHIPIKPSMLLKAPVMVKRRKLPSGLYQDKRARLASEECQIRRRRMLKQLSRRRHAAEEEQGEKEHAEVTLMMNIGNEGQTYALDPQSALRLARAARDVVLAEYQTAYIRIKEGELHLDTLRDEAEQAHATWCDANDQVGAVLSFCHREGIHIDIDSPHVPSLPALDSLPLFPSLLHVANSTDSDTDFDESSSES